MQVTRKVITRAVWSLSLVSMFTDVAGEMLYPIMPVYLRSIGFTALMIGILEGLAELVAGIGKGYFGSLSDHFGKRLVFVRLGYALSALSKPLQAFSMLPAWMFLCRTADRLGKGIRTGARDALLSAESTPETKGRVFGFHRGLDTLGAVIGPCVALVFLAYRPNEYRLLFLLAFLPGLMAVALLFTLREKTLPAPTGKPPYSLRRFLGFVVHADPVYKKMVGAFVVFSLVNSSDYFLLLKAAEAQVPTATIIGMYIFYNVVFAGLSYPLGHLGDGVGLKKVLVAGLAVFATVYGCFSMELGTTGYFVLFAIYGCYAAATDGISKALVSAVLKKEETATGLGAFAAFQSMGALAAGLITGALWSGFGSGAAFGATATVSAMVALYLAYALPNAPSRQGKAA